MPHQASKRCGKGDRCSVLLPKLRPSRDVDAAFPNKLLGNRLDDLIAVRSAQKMRHDKIYEDMFFYSDTIAGIELSCASGYCAVLEEGPAEWSLHPQEVPEQQSNTALNPTDDETPGDTIVTEVFVPTGNQTEDIATVRNQGLAVNDDNESAPENIPQANEPAPVVSKLNGGQSWGWDGFDRRRAAKATNAKPTFNEGWSPRRKSFLDIFAICLPFSFFQGNIVCATSEALQQERKAASIDLGEFLRYLALWLLMSTSMGWSQADFWKLLPFQPGVYFSRVTVPFLNLHVQE
mmetsp:Transcript_26170/g.44619  ORF Transcript_26170/g.44619 Transcript_26170/m.44619 type:complete len:292 (-) Transcript_26170:1465-2340(-)